MINNEEEIWRAHPDIPGIEVSTLGRVRMMDRVVSSEESTKFFKGRILKQNNTGNGYLQLGVKVGLKYLGFVHNVKQVEQLEFTKQALLLLSKEDEIKPAAICS